MVFNTGGIIFCTDYGFIQYESSDKCKEELYDNHNFEHLIRCASSEFGFPELPFRGKCICLAGSTGSHCQFSDQNTCNCNGKALSDGYCECDEVYEGFYCEFKKIITTTQTTPIITTKTTSKEKVKLKTESQTSPSTLGKILEGKGDKNNSKPVETNSGSLITFSSFLVDSKNESIVSIENKKNSGSIIAIAILGALLAFLIKWVSVKWNYPDETEPTTNEHKNPPKYTDVNFTKNESNL
jgi:hypothetical protein